MNSRLQKFWIPRNPFVDPPEKMSWMKWLNSLALCSPISSLLLMPPRKQPLIKRRLKKERKMQQRLLNPRHHLNGSRLKPPLLLNELLLLIKLKHQVLALLSVPLNQRMEMNQRTYPHLLRSEVSISPNDSNKSMKKPNLKDRLLKSSSHLDKSTLKNTTVNNNSMKTRLN